jgi:hypothetical protein
MTRIKLLNARPTGFLQRVRLYGITRSVLIKTVRARVCWELRQPLTVMPVSVLARRLFVTNLGWHLYGFQSILTTVVGQ